MKFRIGDRVRIINQASDYITKANESYVGKKGTVTSIESLEKRTYHVKVDNVKSGWKDPLVNEERLEKLLESNWSEESL